MVTFCCTFYSIKKRYILEKCRKTQVISATVWIVIISLKIHACAKKKQFVILPLKWYVRSSNGIFVDANCVFLRWPQTFKSPYVFYCTAHHTKMLKKIKSYKWKYFFSAAFDKLQYFTVYMCFIMNKFLVEHYLRAALLTFQHPIKVTRSTLSEHMKVFHWFSLLDFS